MQRKKGKIKQTGEGNCSKCEKRHKVKETEREGMLKIKNLFKQTRTIATVITIRRQEMKERVSSIGDPKEETASLIK